MGCACWAACVPACLPASWTACLMAGQLMCVQCAAPPQLPLCAPTCHCCRQEAGGGGEPGQHERAGGALRGRRRWQEGCAALTAQLLSREVLLCCLCAGAAGCRAVAACSRDVPDVSRGPGAAQTRSALLKPAPDLDLYSHPFRATAEEGKLEQVVVDTARVAAEQVKGLSTQVRHCRLAACAHPCLPALVGMLAGCHFNRCSLQPECSGVLLLAAVAVASHIPTYMRTPAPSTLNPPPQSPLAADH